MRGSCFDMEAAPSAEEPKAAEVPTASPETKEASEVKAEVAEEAKEAAEAGNVIILWSKICRGHEWQGMAYFSLLLQSRQTFPCGVCHLVFLRSYWNLNGRHLRPRVQRKDLERVQQKDLRKERERVQQRQRDQKGMTLTGIMINTQHYGHYDHYGSLWDNDWFWICKQVGPQKELSCTQPGLIKHQGSGTWYHCTA